MFGLKKQSLRKIIIPTLSYLFHFSEAKLVKTWTTLLQSQEIAHTPIKMSFYHIYIGSKKLIKFLLHSSNK